MVRMVEHLGLTHGLAEDKVQRRALSGFEQAALQERLEAVTRERDEARAEWQRCLDRANENFANLSAALAREEKLRDAFDGLAKEMGIDWFRPEFDQSRDALSLPRDDTALRQWGAKLLREMANTTVKHECDCGMPCDCYGPSSAMFQLRKRADELEGKL